MKLIFVALIYGQSLAGQLGHYAELVNGVMNKVGVEVGFIYRQVPDIPCLDASSIMESLWCLKRYFREETLQARSIPARPMVLTPRSIGWALGAFTGASYCPRVARRGEHTFLFATHLKDAEVTANIMAHELLHSLGARHREDPSDVMYPYGGLHRISDVYVSEATKRQVRRCLTRLRYLGRHT